MITLNQLELVKDMEKLSKEELIVLSINLLEENQDLLEENEELKQSNEKISEHLKRRIIKHLKATKHIKELKKDINYYQWRTKNLRDDVKDLREEIQEKNKTIIKLNDSNIRLDIDNVELQIQINELKEQLEENNKEHDKDLTRTQNRILNNTKAFLKYYKGTYDDMSRIRSIEKFTNRLVHTVDMIELYKDKFNSADRLERRAKEEAIDQLIDDIKDNIKRHEEEIILDDIEEEIILEYDEDMELYM